MSTGNISLERRGHVLLGGLDRAARVLPDVPPLMARDDGQEGLRAFVERRPGTLRGR